jgi:zinc transport system substrate-binding protein
LKTRIIWLIAGILVALVLVLMIRGIWLTESGRAPEDKLSVTASFYPMAEFTRQVGGDKVDVTTLISPGVEPHDFDPTPQQIAGVYQSRVFIYNGAGLEPWADRLRSELESDGVVVVDASAGIGLRSKETGTREPGSPGGAYSSFDPHIWLDPVLAAREVDNIKQGLIVADPGNRETYEVNAETYKRKLDELDKEFREALAGCSRGEIITSHQAFNYLADRYGLNVITISGLSPNEEPSPQKLAEVTSFANENDVKYIFFETLASPKLADTIAAETGAQTLVLNPLEGLNDEEIAAGKDYITVQKENIQNLRTALGCE